MVNQRGHTGSLNRYYVVVYSHAQIPGMNVYCFVKCVSTVMPAAAPLCHPNLLTFGQEVQEPLATGIGSGSSSCYAGGWQDPQADGTCL